jgi:hypothetical protein
LASSCYFQVGFAKGSTYPQTSHLQQELLTMTDRSIRRAAERQALKAARKAAAREALKARAAQSPAVDDVVNENVEPCESGEPAPALSEARLAANRENSLKSTGPRTPEGRAKVSLNAVKTALTGSTVILPSENAGEYHTHILNYEKLLQPVGPEERCLTQYLADTRWRINRIPALELALISKGHAEFQRLHTDWGNSAVDSTALIEIETRLIYEKQFKNLQLQEARLNRRLEKDMAQLRGLQEARKAKEAEQLAQAAGACLLAQHRNEPFDFASLGFEFSKERFESHLAKLTQAVKQQLLQKALAEAGESMKAAA